MTAALITAVLLELVVVVPAAAGVALLVAAVAVVRVRRVEARLAALTKVNTDLRQAMTHVAPLPRRRARQLDFEHEFADIIRRLRPENRES